MKKRRVRKIFITDPDMIPQGHVTVNGEKREVLEVRPHKFYKRNRLLELILA